MRMNEQGSCLEVTPFATCPSLRNVPLPLINISRLMMHLIPQPLDIPFAFTVCAHTWLAFLEFYIGLVQNEILKYTHQIAILKNIML